MPKVFFQAEENAWKSFENYVQSRGLTDTEALNYLLKLCVTKDLLPENFLINNRSLKFSRTWFIHTIQEAFSRYNYNCAEFNIGRVTLLKTSDFLILPRFKKFGKESLVIQVPEETISTLFTSAEKEGLKPIVAILVILKNNQLELFYINPRSVAVCLPRLSTENLPLCIWEQTLKTEPVIYIRGWNLSGFSTKRRLNLQMYPTPCVLC